MLGTVLFGRDSTSAISRQAPGKQSIQAKPAKLTSPTHDHLTLIAAKQGESALALAARAQQGVDQLNLSTSKKQTISLLLDQQGKNLVTSKYQEPERKWLGFSLGAPKGPINAKDIRPGKILVDRATGKRIQVTGVINTPPQQRTHVTGTYVNNPNGGVSLNPTHVETGILFQFTAKPAPQE